jgi:hypothetical protein
MVNRFHLMHQHRKLSNVRIPIHVVSFCKIEKDDPLQANKLKWSFLMQLKQDQDSCFWLALCEGHNLHSLCQGCALGSW